MTYDSQNYMIILLDCIDASMLRIRNKANIKILKRNAAERRCRLERIIKWIAPAWRSHGDLAMATSPESLYTVYAIDYRPVAPDNPTFLLAVFVLTQPSGGLVSSKKLARWKAIRALHPDADVELLKGIIAELESEVSRDARCLDRYMEWGNLIGISKSTVLSSELPSSLAERLFRTFRLKEGLVDNQEI